MSFVGCAIGDIHYDKLTKYWHNANALQSSAVQRAVSTSMQRAATEAFFLGDIAEGIRDSTGNSMRLSEDAQSEFLSLLMWLDQRINTHIILGNHDWASEGHHSLQLFLTMQEHKVFKRVRFYPTMEKVRIAGVKCALMPFPNIVPPAGTQVGFAHYGVAGAVGDNGRAVHSDGDGDDHKFTCDIIQGHLHTHQRVGRHYFPGTLYQTSFGENPDKGFGLFQPTNGKLGYKWIEQTPPFKLVNLRINKREDFKKLTKDPSTLFKLFVHEDVRVPDDLLTRYPNIVNRLAFANDEEAAIIENDEFATENKRLDLDSRKALPEYLLTKGASKRQIARALEIVDGFRST